jgi:hypothetical protein
LRRVDEHAVGARVLDQKRAAGEGYLGVVARNVFIRKHPIVIAQAPDGSARLKYLARRTTHLCGFLTNNFQC